MQKIDGLKNGIKSHGYYEYLVDLIYCTAGTVLYALSVVIFTAPNKIAPGGVTGIATVLYYLAHLPIGITMFVLNIPLLVLGLRLIGGSFIFKTIVCTVLSSFFVDLFGAMKIPQYHGTQSTLILAALYGGILSGAGLGLVFLRGATTGGSDVASRLLKLKFRHVPMGRMMFLIDMVIILIAAAVFKSVDSALYAILTEFACSKLIDIILYGSDTGKMAVVISNENDKIAQAVINEMGRGLTLLKGKGYYTGTERDVIMCALRRPEVSKLRGIVKETDPQAFIIMCDASEVIGEGFKPITKEL